WPWWQTPRPVPPKSAPTRREYRVRGEMAKSEADVIVVGGGNAAFCAALAAQEQGASVLMLEAAPEDESGGNSRFTAGSVRGGYKGLDDLKGPGARLPPPESAQTEFGPYTPQQIFDRQPPAHPTHP